METYLSPVETHCMNIDYFIPDTENRTKDFNDYAMTRLREYKFFSILSKEPPIRNLYPYKDAIEILLEKYVRICAYV